MNGQFNELRGLAEGIVCDGDVNAAEANALRQWLVSNCEVIDEPACQALAMLLIEMLNDGSLNATESAELKETLRALIAILPDARDPQSSKPERPAMVYPLRPRAP